MKKDTKISTTQKKQLIKNTKHFVNTINKFDSTTLLYMKDLIDRVIKERKDLKNVRKSKKIS